MGQSLNQNFENRVARFLTFYVILNIPSFHLFKGSSYNHLRNIVIGVPPRDIFSDLKDTKSKTNFCLFLSLYQRKAPFCLIEIKSRLLPIKRIYSGFARREANVFNLFRESSFRSGQVHFIVS